MFFVFLTLKRPPNEILPTIEETSNTRTTIYDCYNHVFKASLFQDLYTESQGAAIYALSNKNFASISIALCGFIRCTAQIGGAIYAIVEIATISQTCFTSCKADTSQAIQLFSPPHGQYTRLIKTTVTMCNSGRRGVIELDTGRFFLNTYNSSKNEVDEGGAFAILKGSSALICHFGNFGFSVGGNGFRFDSNGVNCVTTFGKSYIIHNKFRDVPIISDQMLYIGLNDVFIFQNNVNQNYTGQMNIRFRANTRLEIDCEVTQFFVNADAAGAEINASALYGPYVPIPWNVEEPLVCVQQAETEKSNDLFFYLAISLVGALIVCGIVGLTVFKQRKVQEINSWMQDEEIIVIQ